MDPIYVTTEDVNAYGFRVLSDGIDWSAFRVNPVMTYNHIRTAHFSDAGKIVFPIGKWADQAREGSKFRLSPVFNEKYEYGEQCKQMYEDGFLNCASIYIEVLELSEDPELMLPGQTRPTITKSRVREIALTDIPVNWNCHRLTYKGKTITLSADDQSALDDILPIVKLNANKMENTDLKMIAIGLGLKEDATSAEVLAKATEFQNKSTALSAEVETLKAENGKLSARVVELEKQGEEGKLEALLSQAVKSGKITEAQRPHFEALGKTNFDSLKAALDTMQAYTSLSVQVDGDKPGEGTANTSEALAARYDELDKAGKLATLSVEERDILVQAKTAQLRKSGKVK